MENEKRESRFAIDFRTILDQLIAPLTIGIYAFFSALVQIDQNRRDALATFLRTYINKKGKYILFVDNGFGMNEERIFRFHSLFYKIKEQLELMKSGKTPRTIGHNNSGRLALFGIGEVLRVYTCCEEFGLDKVAVFYLTKDKLVEMIMDAAKLGGEGKIDYDIIPKEPWMREYLPETGTIIKLEGIKDKLIPTKGLIKERLPKMLFRKNLRSIWINDELIPEPETLGEKVEFSDRTDELGNVHVLLYKNLTKKSPIRFGADDPIFQDFGTWVARCVAQQDYYMIPNQLLDPSIGGEIGIEVINEDRDHASNDSLSSEFMFSDRYYAILNYLHTTLRAELDRKFAEIQELEITEKAKKETNYIMNEIKSMFKLTDKEIDMLTQDDDDNGKTDEDPKPNHPSDPSSREGKGTSTKGRDSFRLTPKNITIFQGERTTFTAKGNNTGELIAWEINAGGNGHYFESFESLNENGEVTLSINFHASANPGKYLVTAKTADDFAEASVTIIKKNILAPLVKIEEEWYLIKLVTGKEAAQGPIVSIKTLKNYTGVGEIEARDMQINLSHPSIVHYDIAGKFMRIWPSIITEHIDCIIPDHQELAYGTPQEITKRINGLINKFMLKT